MREILCMVPDDWHQFRWTHPISVAIVDGSPFSGVITESQEVWSHIVAPERRQHVVSMWVSIFLMKLFLVCVILIEGVPSLCNDSCELRRPASIQLKPVDFVLWIRTPRSTPHVIFIVWALGTTKATTHAAVCHFQRNGAPTEDTSSLELWELSPLLLNS